MIEPPFDIQQKHNRYVISLQDKEISRAASRGISENSSKVMPSVSRFIIEAPNMEVLLSSFASSFDKVFHSEAIDVERGTNRVIDASGEIQSDFYCR
ncbi:hypothetical protein EfmAA55_17390 [Enterococcus faecium]|nr:hypothetical protein [Enterococcus faecium]BDP67310.1 hypothetical protein EfmAA55_17390 [Enterococcus faecium]